MHVRNYIKDTREEAPFQVGILFTLTVQVGLDPVTVTQSTVPKGQREIHVHDLWK